MTDAPATKEENNPGGQAFDLSIVIPAYNEEARILATLERVADYVRQCGLRVETIVSDDGSDDGTRGVVERFARENGGVVLAGGPPNRGKGRAVRVGVMAASGDVVLFMDADCSTPMEELDKLMPYVKSGVEVAIGSRSIEGSDVRVRQSLLRQSMGKVFNLLVRMTGLSGFRDTQCGFKLFSGPAAKALFSCQKIAGFGFDVEILYLARRWGWRVEEVPVSWINSPQSKVRIVADPLKMVLELLRIVIYDRRGAYPKRPPAGD